MIVKFKSFDVEMEIKNKGVELEVRDTNRTFLGDLIVTKTQIIWCKGKTGRNRHAHPIVIRGEARSSPVLAPEPMPEVEPEPVAVAEAANGKAVEPEPIMDLEDLDTPAYLR